MCVQGTDERRVSRNSIDEGENNRVPAIYSLFVVSSQGTEIYMDTERWRDEGTRQRNSGVVERCGEELL